MIQNVNSRKETIPVTAPAGDNVIVAGTEEAWIYVHEIQGDLDVNGTLSVLSGSTILATWDLESGQGLTTSDLPGDDNSPRYRMKPEEDFILRLSAGATFQGAVVYSIRK